MSLPMLTVYSRQGCHLCEILIEELLLLVRDRAQLDVQDIDSRPDWVAEYGVRVPVVELDGRCLCQYQLDREAVSAALDEAAAR